MTIVPLPYTLHTRYKSIALAWTIILTPPTFLNIGLFYGLWYGSNLDRILVLTLPTAILGIFTVIAIIERIYKLTKRTPEYRPLNSPRYALDVFQWGYFLALLLISALVSSALGRGDVDGDGHEFQIRLVSLPSSVLMFMLAFLTLLSLVLDGMGATLPFKMGSMGGGEVVRPAVFYVVEDVIAVDGDGKMEWRSKWGERYDGSEVFRLMVWELSLVWMVVFFVLGGVFTVLCMWLPVQAVYAVGWAGPFPVVGLNVVWTVLYVKARLREERKKEEVNGNGSVQIDGARDERTPLLGDAV